MCVCVCVWGRTKRINYVVAKKKHVGIIIQKVPRDIVIVQIIFSGRMGLLCAFRACAGA